MTFCFYAIYLNSDLKTENFIQNLKNFITCDLLKVFESTERQDATEFNKQGAEEIF